MLRHMICTMALAGAQLAAAADTTGAAALRALTGERCIVVWMQDLSDGRNYDSDGIDGKTYQLMGMDTDDGRGERVILPTQSNYHCPMPTPDGTRVVYTNYPAQEIYCVNFDGTENTFLASGAATDLWDDPQTGITWVYFKYPSTSATSGPVYRMQLDDPGLVETVWTGTMVWIHNFDVSPNGTKAAMSAANHNLTFLDLMAGTERVLASGCNINMSPDDSNYTLVMLEDHFSMDMYAPGGTKVANLPFPVDGAQHARWSNDRDFMVYSGPYPGGWRDNGPHVELQVVTFKHPYTDGFDQNIQLTNNVRGDYLARLQVGIKPSAPLLPMLQLSTNELIYQVESGTTAYQKTLTVTSPVQEGLSGLTVTEDVPWLSVTPSATSGAAITLANAVDCAGLTPHIYTGYVTLKADGHRGRTYCVTLVIGGPYNGVPLSVPGTIEAEEYDIGGLGVSYMDPDLVNEGGQFRSDGVDIERCGDVGGGYNVGWITAGEWLDYSIRVDRTAAYVPHLRYAGSSAGSQIHLEVDGQAGETVILPTTDSWQSWQTFVLPALPLAAGQSTLRIVSENGGLNINWLSLELPEVDSTNAVLIGSPRGGEQFAVGDTIKVQWYADTLYAPGIVVQFSPDGGETWHMLTQETIANKTGQGVFSWVVPSFLREQSTVSTACLIRVEDYSAPFSDMPEGFFTITAAPTTATVQQVLHSTPPFRVQRSSGHAVLYVAHTGPHHVRLYSLSGALLWHMSGNRSAEYRVPSVHQTAILQLEAGTARWSVRGTDW